MRFRSAALAISTSSIVVALAADARATDVDLALFGGYAVGSNGGDQEDSCDNGATCHDRTRPHSGVWGARAGHTFPGGFGLEVEYTSWSVSSSLGRTTTLVGEQANVVPAEITDTLDWSGFSFAIGARFTKAIGPIELTGVLQLGQMWFSAEAHRSGTIAVDGDPARRLTPDPANPDKIDDSFKFIQPELRVAVPLPMNIRVGVGLAYMIGTTTDVRPKILQSPTCAQPCTQAPTYNGQSVGFVPQPNAQESVLDAPQMFRATIFAGISF
jgi:hypothetical protein